MKRRRIIILTISIILSLLAGTLVFILYRKSKGSFKRTLVNIAKRELNRWEGFSELNQEMSQTLIQYWKSVGKSFTERQMMDSSVHNTYPWSSAFISYLFYKAGAKDRFPYSAAHSTYFQAAKRMSGQKDAPLIAHRITEYAPKVGDLVVNTRLSGTGFDTSGHFPAHGELVVEVGKGYIKTIGGNVQDSVKQRTFKTNSEGLLEGNSVSFFMVIENKIE